jgi:hypothetical protein
MRALSKKCTLDERTPQELQTSVRPNPSRRAEGPNTDVRPRSANLPRPSMAGAFFRRWQRRTNLWRRRTNLRTGSERLTGVIRRHGRGHGALVSHSTDVGCISEENTCEEASISWCNAPSCECVCKCAIIFHRCKEDTWRSVRLLRVWL